MEDREPYITGGKMRDKYLTEAMGGKLVMCCVVELENEFDIDETCVRQEDSEYLITDCTYGKDGKTPEECKYWQQRIAGGIIDFSTWEGFGKLWEWASKQDWWLRFKGATQKEIGAYSLRDCIEDKWINPSNFADAIYEYLKNRG